MTGSVINSDSCITYCVSTFKEVTEWLMGGSTLNAELSWYHIISLWPQIKNIDLFAVHRPTVRVWTERVGVMDELLCLSLWWRCIWPSGWKRASRWLPAGPTPVSQSGLRVKKCSAEQQRVKQMVRSEGYQPERGGTETEPYRAERSHL